jgi:hypothetical protein
MLLVRKEADGLHLNSTVRLRRLSRGVAIRSVLHVQKGIARPRDFFELAMPALRDDDAITVVRLRTIQLRHLHHKIHLPARRKEIRVFEMFIPLLAMSEMRDLHHRHSESAEEIRQVSALRKATRQIGQSKSN